MSFTAYPDPAAFTATAVTEPVPLSVADAIPSLSISS